MSDARAWVGLGSNLGDRERHLTGALQRLERTPGVRVLARSSWYETDPVGGPDGQPPYLNGALSLETRLGPRDLLRLLHAIERAEGRRRGVRNGPRTLDLDLLICGTTRVEEPALRIPHPRMEERLFVLVPLGEIDPGLVLPSGRGVLSRIDELRASQREEEPRRLSAVGSPG